MIELGEKYKLKKIRGFENADNEYYKSNRPLQLRLCNL